MVAGLTGGSGWVCLIVSSARHGLRLSRFVHLAGDQPGCGRRKGFRSRVTEARPLLHQHVPSDGRLPVPPTMQVQPFARWNLTPWGGRRCSPTSQGVWRRGGRPGRPAARCARYRPTGIRHRRTASAAPYLAQPVGELARRRLILAAPVRRIAFGAEAIPELSSSAESIWVRGPDVAIPRV